MLAKILTSLLLSVSCSALLAGAPNNQKALGTGFVDDVILTQIGIETDEAGKPSVAFYGKTKDYVAKLGKLDVQISLSDEDEYVLAFVIITHL